MKKILLFAFLCLLNQQIFAQTSPATFNLSSGTYTFTAWDSSSNINPALSYPSNMIFHTLGAINPSENTPSNGDWACTYDLQTGCSIKGKALEGVAFRNIAMSQDSACRANGSGASVYVGDATVALNTTVCENITVSWIGRMLNSFNFVNTPPNQVSRFYGIACQYRIGTSGAFTNLPGNYLFNCNSDTATYKPFGTADTLIVVLPDTCNNQPVVELRWIYHQTAQNAGGPRPILGLDDINITRDIITSNRLPQVNSKPLFVYPNPSCDSKIYLSKQVNFVVVDLLGQIVNQPNTAKELNTENFSKGIYFVKTSDGEIVKFLKQ